MSAYSHTSNRLSQVSDISRLQESEESLLTRQFRSNTCVSIPENQQILITRDSDSQLRTFQVLPEDQSNFHSLPKAKHHRQRTITDPSDNKRNQVTAAEGLNDCCRSLSYGFLQNMAARHDQIVNSSGYGTPQSYTGQPPLKHGPLQVQTLPHNFSLTQHKLHNQVPHSAVQLQQSQQPPAIIEVHRQLPPELPEARTIPRKSNFSKIGPAMKNIWQVVKYSIILGALLGIGISAYTYEPKPVANRGITDVVMMTLQVWLQSLVNWLSEFVLNPIFLSCVLLVLFLGVTTAICLRRGRRQEQNLARRILKSLSQQLSRGHHRHGNHGRTTSHPHHSSHSAATHALVHAQNSGPTVSYAPGHRIMSTPNNYAQSPPTIQEVGGSPNALRPYQLGNQSINQFHPYPIINFGDHFHTETRTRTVNSYNQSTADGGNERIDEVSNYRYQADTRPVYEAVSRKISVESQR